MFETDITEKIIADSGIIQHLIANCDFICDNYDDYSDFQTGSGEVLLSYEKDNLLLPLNNSFLNLTNVWYASDRDFNLMSIIH